jgi:uncharacterized membrane protein
MYFTLTYSVAPIAFGPLQFRPGEALTLLPLLFPESILGITIGCFLANVFSPYGWYDMLFGTLATLIAAIMTYTIGRSLKTKKVSIKALYGSIPPVLVNALMLPLIWLFFSSDQLYLYNFITIFATQTGVILFLGVPLVVALSKIKIFSVKKMQN